MIFSFKKRSASKHHVGFYVKVIHFGFPPTQVDPFFFKLVIWGLVVWVPQESPYVEQYCYLRGTPKKHPKPPSPKPPSLISSCLCYLAIGDEILCSYMGDYFIKHFSESLSKPGSTTNVIGVEFPNFFRSKGMFLSPKDTRGSKTWRFGSVSQFHRGDFGDVASENGIPKKGKKWSFSPRSES